MHKYSISIERLTTSFKVAIRTLIDECVKNKYNNLTTPSGEIGIDDGSIFQIQISLVRNELTWIKEGEFYHLDEYPESMQKDNSDNTE